MPRGRPPHLPKHWRELAYWAAIEDARDRWSGRSVKRAAKFVQRNLSASNFAKVFPCLDAGTLRNMHRRVERRAEFDLDFAAILPSALEWHRKLNEGERRILLARMALSAPVQRALRVKIVAQ